jgi:hypothetical protein
LLSIKGLIAFDAGPPLQWYFNSSLEVLAVDVLEHDSILRTTKNLNFFYNIFFTPSEHSFPELVVG